MHHTTCKSTEIVDSQIDLLTDEQFIRRNVTNNNNNNTKFI